MNWTSLLLYLDVSIALLLMIRVLYLGLRSVRTALVFLLLPDILETLASFLSGAVRFDFRILWMASDVLCWGCLVGLVYALLAAVFSQLPEFLRYFRRLWTVAFVAAILTALSQRERYLWSQVIDNLVHQTFVLDRAVTIVAGFILLVVLGFVFWYPVKLSQNLTILSIGVATRLATLMANAIFLGMVGGASLRWVFPTMEVVWIACLAYWILFLSRQGETELA